LSLSRWREYWSSGENLARRITQTFQLAFVDE
jgi:hypothetical protein